MLDKRTLEYRESGLNLTNIMTTQETAYAEIERLIKSFKDMSAAQRKGLNEMQTRLGCTCLMSVHLEDDLDRVRNLECEIVRVDEEFDRRVYVLYGLTKEEIKVVGN